MELDPKTDREEPELEVADSTGFERLESLRRMSRLVDAAGLYEKTFIPAGD